MLPVNITHYPMYKFNHANSGTDDWNRKNAPSQSSFLLLIHFQQKPATPILLVQYSEGIFYMPRG